MPRPTLRRLAAWRIVADPVALDGARWEAPPEGGGPVVVLRTAPDEAIGIGAAGAALQGAGAVGDPDAIVLPDAGLAGAWLDAPGLERVVARVEWRLPVARPGLGQGKIAGVPAKLWLAPAGEMRGVALLVTQAAFAHELAERLGFGEEVLP